MGLKSTPFAERSKNELATISLSAAARLCDNDIMIATTSTSTKLIDGNPECSGRQTFPKCSPKDCKKRVSFNLVRSDSFNNLNVPSDSIKHQHCQQYKFSTTTNDDCSHSTNGSEQSSECQFRLEITAPDLNSTTNNNTNILVNNQNNNYLTEDSAGHSKIQSKTSVINRSLLKFSLSNDASVMSEQYKYDSGIGSGDSSRTSSLEFDKTPDSQLLTIRPPIPRTSKSDSDIPAAISSSKCQNSVTSCRNDSYTSGYSPAKAHRRKASLGTKDFAVVFPNLVADNIELRCRVVS